MFLIKRVNNRYRNLPTPTFAVGHTEFRHRRVREVAEIAPFSGTDAGRWPFIRKYISTHGIGGG
jgi:hypothetical protein